MSDPRRVEPLEHDLEYTMSDMVFSAFQRIALEHTGIDIAAGKRAMIINRFSRRLIALGLDSFEQYLALVTQTGHPEIREFIDTITTNLTYFYREAHHFDVLKKTVFPELAIRAESNQPIRIWSSACSSGQEPYSLAITAKETTALDSYKVKILCTDIDSKMVQLTQVGSYDNDQMRGLSQERQEKWFPRSASGRFVADESLRSMLICRQLNLFENWPIKPGVDVIMCRNVLIYFNPAYQKKLLKRFSAIQMPGSYLFLGHSETLDGFERSYERVANTVYVRL